MDKKGVYFHARALSLFNWSVPSDAGGHVSDRALDERLLIVREAPANSGSDDQNSAHEKNLDIFQV